MVVEVAAIKVVNNLLSMALKQNVANKLSPMGELFKFEVDIKEKQLTFGIHLKGEVEPLEGSLKVLDFNFTVKDGKLFLIVRKVSLVAREWMALALQKYWPGEVKVEITGIEYILKPLKAAGYQVKG